MTTIFLAKSIFFYLLLYGTYNNEKIYKFKFLMKKYLKRMVIFLEYKNIQFHRNLKITYLFYIHISTNKTTKNTLRRQCTSSVREIDTQKVFFFFNRYTKLNFKRIIDIIVISARNCNFNGIVFNILRNTIFTCYLSQN